MYAIDFRRRYDSTGQIRGASGVDEIAQPGGGRERATGRFPVGEEATGQIQPGYGRPTEVGCPPDGRLYERPGKIGVVGGEPCRAFAEGQAIGEVRPHGLSGGDVAGDAAGVLDMGCQRIERIGVAARFDLATVGGNAGEQVIEGLGRAAAAAERAGNGKVVRRELDWRIDDLAEKRICNRELGQPHPKIQTEPQSGDARLQPPAFQQSLTGSITGSGQIVEPPVDVAGLGRDRSTRMFDARDECSVFGGGNANRETLAKRLKQKVNWAQTSDCVGRRCTIRSAQSFGYQRHLRHRSLLRATPWRLPAYRNLRKNKVWHCSIRFNPWYRQARGDIKQNG